MTNKKFLICLLCIMSTVALFECTASKSKHVPYIKISAYVRNSFYSKEGNIGLDTVAMIWIGDTTRLYNPLFDDTTTEPISLFEVADTLPPSHYIDGWRVQPKPR